MRLIFSKDRPAQLDLLLHSLERYAHTEDDVTVVIYNGAIGNTRDTDYDLGYRFVQEPPRIANGVLWVREQGDFNGDLRASLGPFADDTVTFFCDDDVVFRPLPSDPRVTLEDNLVICHSWRLARLDTRGVWNWPHLPRHDHGYPGSIDGHTFRTVDVLRMIDGQRIDNPTMLETILAHRCEMLAEERPLMSAWPEQVLVSVPVNRVSEQSGCEYGLVYPQTTEELNARWLAGERIARDALDFSGVNGCHHELAYEWEPR